MLQVGAEVGVEDMLLVEVEVGVEMLCSKVGTGYTGWEDIPDLVG